MNKFEKAPIVALEVLHSHIADTRTSKLSVLKTLISQCSHVQGDQCAAEILHIKGYVGPKISIFLLKRAWQFKLALGQSTGVHCFVPPSIYMY